MLQLVSEVMKSGIGLVQKTKGSNLLDVQCPNDIIIYQKNMGGVNCGNQHQVMGVLFARKYYTGYKTQQKILHKCSTSKCSLQIKRASI